MRDFNPYRDKKKQKEEEEAGSVRNHPWLGDRIGRIGRVGRPIFADIKNQVLDTDVTHGFNSGESDEEMNQLSTEGAILAVPRNGDRNEERKKWKRYSAQMFARGARWGGNCLHQLAEVVLILIVMRRNKKNKKIIAHIRLLHFAAPLPFYMTVTNKWRGVLWRDIARLSQQALDYRIESQPYLGRRIGWEHAGY
ncbi:hypothetical protein PRIPAC_79025 [Pristionchus pacificus]|uniref:Uncharacterized protein n=1 Tax=Pristionchus pacificus TaxID=54126 RepID=A0A2A6CNE9_PRIPA|nr:hypothetical protein PRIPAC_79025 [Pristionchus pacificus]|eukprot:PDM79583.1 hypothetical protein PRIPAC_32162 [Pristionchus pacificus]